MELFAALLTVTLFWRFVHVSVTGNRAQSVRKAGPLLLKIRRPGARISQVVFVASGVLLGGLFIWISIRNYRTFPTAFVPAMGLYVALTFLSCASVFGTGVELRQHGMVPIRAGLWTKVAFAPWGYIRYCRWFCGYSWKWNPGGRLLVCYQDRSETYPVTGKQQAEATAVLARYVEVRDATGTIVAEAPMGPNGPEKSDTDTETLPPEFRRWQFSLRTLLLLILVASSGFSWLGIRTQRARTQRAIVQKLEEKGFDLEVTHMGVHVYTLRIDASKSSAKASDEDLREIERLSRLRWLDLSGSAVTDAGLVHLEHLTLLDWLDLHGTQVTEEGVQKLQIALPETKISH